MHPDNLHNTGGVLSIEGHFSILASETDLVKVNATGGRSRYDVPHGDAQERAGQDQRQSVLQNSQSGHSNVSGQTRLCRSWQLYRRRVHADLQSGSGDTPLSARSDRPHYRVGVLAA